MKPSFYTDSELEEIGLKSYGKKVLISRYARIYSPEKISIGDNVRIDDFCILSGNIKLGSNIHISAFCALHAGNYGIEMEDYTGLSARTTIYAAIDDFSGDYLIGPIHEHNQTHVTGGLVRICAYSQVGAGSLIFPNLTIGEGCVLGAMSMAKKSLAPWGIYAGIPAKIIKNRSKNLLKLLVKNE